MYTGNKNVTPKQFLIITHIRVYETPNLQNLFILGKCSLRGKECVLDIKMRRFVFVLDDDLQFYAQLLQLYTNSIYCITTSFAN